MRPARGGRRVSFPAVPVLVLGLALTAAGCVDLKADAVLAVDGSSRLSLVYRVPRELESLDRYRGPAGRGLPFPADRGALDRRAAASPGTTVSRWSREDVGDEIRINAELRFSSMTSFLRFLDPEGARAKFASEEGRRVLRIELSPGVRNLKDAEAWTRLSYGDYSIALSVTLPSRAESADPGELSATGTIARFSSTTADLLERPEPLIWTIRW